MKAGPKNQGWPIGVVHVVTCRGLSPAQTKLSSVPSLSRGSGFLSEGHCGAHLWDVFSTL